MTQHALILRCEDTKADHENRPVIPLGEWFVRTIF